jgi:outer membrane protein assembly factor BamD (BamD/ComL family)
LLFATLVGTVTLAGPARSQTATPGTAATAAPAPAAVATGAAPAAGSVPLVPPRQPRRGVQRAPEPKPEQLAALAELQKEAAAYEADAKDYRAAMTRIIRHHYEQKRRTVLSALEREIAIETEHMRKARAEAIRRLEAFVARYSGVNAHPESTPDAMFRLAALYEEDARDAATAATPQTPGAAPPPADLTKAVALYKRIVVDFPTYRETAGVLYYLGHAYSDMGRIDEAQQVWRSLVCRNHYKYPVPPDPKDPQKDSIQRLPQDHDAEWWLGWMQRHPEPLDLARKRQETEARRPAPRRRAARAAAEPVVQDDEDTYKNPYPADCQPVFQHLEPGQDPRYVGELWWQIGDYHFDEVDPYGGPYNLNRAETAYRHAMRFKKPPVFGVAMYKLAWTFYKQQRYETAVRQFVELLHYTDEQEKATGNPGADFRSEAYAYIAGSVTYLDFQGPGADDPYIARNDIFDLESDVAVIEQKMRTSIERLGNASLVPQDKPWTIEIYKALAYEFKEYGQFHNLIEIDELMLKKWPLHPLAPEIQYQIAVIYEQLSASAKGAEGERYARLALEARGKLVNYVATPSHTPEWVEANKDDPEAIRKAELLVREGLQRAAADHTNAARAFVEQARTAPDGAEKTEAFERALREYEAAARAWGGYLHQDENADDAYTSRYWLADALTNVVLIRVQLGRVPSDEEVKLALDTAREVRDSNEGDEYMQPAALMIVRVAQQTVAAQYKLHEQTNGAQGFARITELQFEGEGESKKYKSLEVPELVQAMIRAFDEYISTVPVEKDPFKNHDHFAYLAGETPFFYGQFEEAERRLMPIYQQQCGKTKYGYLAWEKLITMANQRGDTERGRALANASKTQSCAIDEEQKIKEGGISDPTIQRGYFQDAAAAYKKAQEMPDGPERNKMWRTAAALYKEALAKAPHRDEAPEAAMLGASAYKQVGEYDQAIEMYELFIKEYGSDERLDKLQKGDPQKNAAPDPKKYEERVKFLKLAYDELATAYVLFFDYRAAARTFDTIASIKRFKEEERRTAAENSVFLYASFNERDKMRAARSTYFALNPSAEQRAKVDWLIAEADLKQWDERGPDRGDNQVARLKAIQAMDEYHRQNNKNRAAAEFVVRAAYAAQKLRRAGGDARFADWCGNTISAFDAYKASAGSDEKGNKALGSEQADMAAECEYRALDEQIKREFDYEAGHHRYQGELPDVTKKFKEDVEKGAKGWFDKLQSVITKYESRRWAVAARARQGSLYDSCRTGLFNAQEPGLKLYVKKEEDVLKKLDKLCEDEGSEVACGKADDFRAKRRADWRKTREDLLNNPDRAMVAGYAEAIIWARAWKLRSDAVDKAVQRLAFFTDILGDDKLREYTSVLKDPSTQQPFQYTDKLFLRMRRGMTADVEAEVLPAPLPVLVQ